MKKIGTEGLTLIKKFEGLKLNPYLCPAGVPTIGYGSTRYPDGRKVKLSDPAITVDRAEEILLATLGTYENAVNRLVKVPVEQNEFDALVSFAYNLGPVALAGSTLLKMLNAGDRDGALGQFMRWTRSKGKILPGLEARREAEQKLFWGEV